MRKVDSLVVMSLGIVNKYGSSLPSENYISFFIISFAQIILLTVILSLLEKITPLSFLSLQVILCVITESSRPVSSYAIG